MFWQTIIGFDTESGIPLWTSYTVSGNMTNNTNIGKWIEDPRLETNHTGSCQRLSSIVQTKDVDYIHLFPKGTYESNLLFSLLLILFHWNIKD